MVLYMVGYNPGGEGLIIWLKGEGERKKKDGIILNAALSPARNSYYNTNGRPDYPLGNSNTSFHTCNYVGICLIQTLHLRYLMLRNNIFQ